MLAVACIFRKRNSNRTARLGFIIVGLAAALASSSSSAKAERLEDIASLRVSSASGIFAQWALPTGSNYIVALNAFAIFQTLLIVILLRRRERTNKDGAGPGESKKREETTADLHSGSTGDIAEQRLAREVLERTGGRLIEGQEIERRRIARELHDDICQRLTLLSLEIEQARKVLDESSIQRDIRMSEIRQHCCKIADDVQALSHELHSSKLDHLGLEAALRSFCREFARQQNVEIELAQDGIPIRLPRDISLCLFRVAQEALRNAMKHSGVTRFTVDLLGTDDWVQMEIRDTGVGFDMQHLAQANGLGLVSMQERVHLVEGIFSIDSAPNQGTRIWVVIPLAGKMLRPVEPTVSAKVALTV